MIAIKYIFPNGLTALNIFCGSAAIISLFQSQPEKPYLPVVLIGFAAFFDLLDGLVAKLLHATSEFGKQLDSLADMVSFGLAPALIMYKLLEVAFSTELGSNTILADNQVVLYLALILAVFTALRLARFNITTFNTTDFIGLPVPASALIVVSLWFEYHNTSNDFFKQVIINPYFLLCIIGFLSFLMVSNITMLSLKFNGISLKKNLWQHILLVGALILVIMFGTSALFLVMVFYLTLSILKNVAFLLKNRIHS